MRHTVKVCALIAAGTFSTMAHASPFTNCPSKAFLLQGSPVAAYELNLATGTYTVLQNDVGIAGNINAVGFNDIDRYIYGYNSNLKTIVQIDNSFKATALNINGLPENVTFYVGDTYNNNYYLYRNGTGFYKIDLSPLATDINANLTAVLITPSTPASLTDFAFHPFNNNLYGVDNKSGTLYEFDINSGETRTIGDTGVTGTFGAAYFDVDGYLYIARNNDGFIYRIDLGAVEVAELEGPKATLFAIGPTSSQNDGARCAKAPIIDDSEPATIDFGDAPASYGTLLQDNGARHEIDGTTYLGFNAPAGKYNGPDSSNFEDPDDDGIGFVTSLETGLDSAIQVIASTEGYLNAWFDWNQDGDFEDEGEQLISEQLLATGSNTLVVRIPEDATPGQTWSRFRFSQQPILSPSGGSTTGEVEDYLVEITNVPLRYSYYPSSNGWTTIAFEDNWPQTADYDMNDVVFALRYTTVVNTLTNNVERIDIRGKLLALGGSYHSGFAIHLPSINASSINSSTVQMRINDIPTGSPLELGRTQAIFIINDHLNEAVTPICSFYRTQQDCDQNITFNFDLSIPFSEEINANNMPAAPFDPFIFATPNYYHGSAFSQAPGRSYEIHLADHPPTEAFDVNFWGLQEDTSSAEEGRYYRTKNNLPWAMEMSSDWQWPKERIDLLQAYPSFAEFVTSSGQKKNNWYAINEGNTQHIFMH
ncbi:LruC domain-containing protein [Marinagarivorans algicola]|uniref:LruC domain-containing protein n=1 Tax=Marinagarivorans algicola TaxID=1513270 RepID=UPI0037362FFD